MKVKPRTRLLLMVLGVSILICVWGVQVGHSPQYASNSISEFQIRSEAPLVIVGNAQLAAAASEGNGSRTSPYLLAHKVINVSKVLQDGISISDTNQYFILKNCVVTDSYEDPQQESYAGVRLFNVTHARIENVTAFQNYYGILLQGGSNNNTLIGNNVSFSVAIGIGLFQSHNNTVIGNIAINVYVTGFRLNFGNYNVLTGNFASGSQYGVEVLSSSFNQITQNILPGNDHCVYESGVCIGNVIEGNVCGTSIPGFLWFSVGLGLLCIIGLAGIWERIRTKNISN